jgi:hypothetical protein
MSEENIEFKILDYKLLGSDTVVFRLEDGAMVKVRVDIGRAGVATNFKNPDGSPNYNIGADLRITIIPPEKKFSIPKSQLPQVPPKESKIKPI